MSHTRAASPMRALLLLTPFLLLAGCAQLDDAKVQLEEAKTELAEAKREAQEAKDRLDRVRSATIVRTERADVRVQAIAASGEIIFDVTATRQGVPLPRENLTAAPRVTVQIDNATAVTCDPLVCTIEHAVVDKVTWGWADETARVNLTTPLARQRAEAVVTTAVGDATT